MFQKLSDSQRRLLALGAIIICLQALYPPWCETYDGQATHTVKPLAYAIIVSPPKPSREVSYIGVRIDTERLVLQLLATVTGMAAVVFFAGLSEEKKK